MEFGVKTNKIVVTLMIGFILMILMVLLRPLFVGQVAQSCEPYNITHTDGTEEVVTPSAQLSATSTDRRY